MRRAHVNKRLRRLVLLVASTCIGLALCSASQDYQLDVGITGPLLQNVALPALEPDAAWLPNHTHYRALRQSPACAPEGVAPLEGQPCCPLLRVQAGTCKICGGGPSPENNICCTLDYVPPCAKLSEGMASSAPDLPDGTSIRPSAADCWKGCRNHPSCFSFTYETSSSTCHLKGAPSASMTAQADALTYDMTGCKPQIETEMDGSIPSCAKYLPGIDRMGGDINVGSTTKAVSAEDCFNMCMKSGPCIAFNWKAPPKNSCWMKSFMAKSLPDTPSTDANFYDLSECKPAESSVESGCICRPGFNVQHAIQFQPMPICAACGTIAGTCCRTEAPQDKCASTQEQNLFCDPLNLCKPCGNVGQIPCKQAGPGLGDLLCQEGLSVINGLCSGGANHLDVGLHPIIRGSSVFYTSANGQALVTLDSSTSHTHELGAVLSWRTWEDGETGDIVGMKDVLQTTYGVGSHTVILTIYDNLNKSASTAWSFTVVASNDAPGALVRLYDGDDPANIDTPAIFAYLSDSVTLDAGTLPALPGSVVAQIIGTTPLPDNPLFGLDGAPAGSKATLLVDGEDYSIGTRGTFTSGSHSLELRLVLTEATTVKLTVNNQPAPNATVDLTVIPPVLNALTSSKTVSPGTVAAVTGFALEGAKFTIDGEPVTTDEQTDTMATFIWPQHAAGTASLVASNDNGESNAIEVLYKGDAGGTDSGGPYGTSPKFTQTVLPIPGFDATNGVTSLAFCHGALYAGLMDGWIIRVNVGETYSHTEADVEKLIQVPEPKHNVLGLACDPRDSSDADFKLYISHNWLYIASGQPPEGAVDFGGAVSYIQPNADNIEVVPVIENLSVSNHDHGVNCLDFHHNGKLLVCVGSNTNAGIAADKFGLLDESPYSGAILQADIRNAQYDGKITYEFLENAPADVSALDPTDQRANGWLRSTNPYITHYALGARNSFGMFVTLTGKVMLTTNGPNSGGWGAAMTGIANGEPTTGEDPGTPDAVWFDLQEGCYLGSANPSLCRDGVEESCKFIPLGGWLTPGTGPAPFCPPDIMLPSPICGLVEYKSLAFGGAYDGDMFISGYLQASFHYFPKEDPPRYITDDEDSLYPGSLGVDLIQAPGGVHVFANYQGGDIRFNIPDDPVLLDNQNPSLYDISPAKAAKTQTAKNTFIIGGENFQYISGPVSVSIGGAAATDIRIQGNRWILGTIPSNPSGACPDDVSVSFGTTTLTMANVFCYLDDLPAPNLPF